MRLMWSLSLTVLVGLVSVGLGAAQGEALGFPPEYQATFQHFFTLDRADSRQVRITFANEAALSRVPGEPYPYGSTLVMEVHRAQFGADGSLVVDEAGRFVPEQLTSLFVMRKEPGFGAAYGAERSGEWAYAAFRPNGQLIAAGPSARPCAACHQQAGAERDWVFRDALAFDPSAGAVPRAPSRLESGRVELQRYQLLPATLLVTAGHTVLWDNLDEAAHTITAADGSFDSGTLAAGATFSFTFLAPGTFTYACVFHPGMAGTIVVEAAR